MNTTHRELLVNEVISLQPFGTRHVSALYRIIRNEREQLKEWLPWVDNIQSEQDFLGFATAAVQRVENGIEISFAVINRGQPVGRVGLYSIDPYNRVASIGYWLSEGAQGCGIMTNACRAIVRYGFAERDLNRIEIKCGTGNAKSAAIPERLQFIKEGVLRQAEYLNGQFIDLHAYAQLLNEWKSIQR